MQIRFVLPPRVDSPLARLDPRWRLAGLVVVLVALAPARTPDRCPRGPGAGGLALAWPGPAAAGAGWWAAWRSPLWRSSSPRSRCRSRCWPAARARGCAWAGSSRPRRWACSCVTSALLVAAPAGIDARRGGVAGRAAPAHPADADEPALPLPARRGAGPAARCPARARLPQPRRRATPTAPSRPRPACCSCGATPGPTACPGHALPRLRRPVPLPRGAPDGGPRRRLLRRVAVHGRRPRRRSTWVVLG